MVLISLFEKECRVQAHFPGWALDPAPGDGLDSRIGQVPAGQGQVSL